MIFNNLPLPAFSADIDHLIPLQIDHQKWGEIYEKKEPCQPFRNVDPPQSASKRLKGIQHQLPNYRAELEGPKSPFGDIRLGMVKLNTHHYFACLDEESNCEIMLKAREF